VNQSSALAWPAVVRLGLTTATGWRRSSGELAHGAAAYRPLSVGAGRSSGLLGWRWCCCGDGEAARPAGDWQRQWRRAALLLRALRAMKEEPGMRKWRRGQERAVAGVITRALPCLGHTWQGSDDARHPLASTRRADTDVGWPLSYDSVRQLNPKPSLTASFVAMKTS